MKQILKRTHTTTLITLCAVFALFSGCTDTRVHNREGELLRSQRKYPEAIKHYKKTLATFPDSKLAKREAMEGIEASYFEWAQKNVQLQRYTQAIEQIDIFLDKFPQTKYKRDTMDMLVLALTRAGETQVNIGLPQNATELFYRVLREFPNHSLVNDVKRAMYRMGSIAFHCQNGIWEVNCDGTNPRKLLDEGNGELSPDGKKLVYITPEDKEFGPLYVLELGAEEPQMLFKNAIGFKPHWFQDNNRVVVNKYNKYSRRRLFQVINTVGEPTGKVAYTKQFKHKDNNAFDLVDDISPDNKAFIAYNLDSRDYHNLGFIATNFSNYGVLHESELPIRDALWSSDGKVIYFATDKGIYTIPFKGSLRVSTYLNAEEHNIQPVSFALAPYKQLFILLARDLSQDDKPLKFYFIDKDANVFPLEIPALKSPIDPDYCTWRVGFELNKKGNGQAVASSGQ